MIQNQQIKNSLLTYNIIQTLPPNTPVPWSVSLADGHKAPAASDRSREEEMQSK